MDKWGSDAFTFMQGVLEGFNVSKFRMPGFGYNSVLDILIIAFFIYKFVIWIKETRAWSLFKGLIVLLIGFLLSYLLQLRTVVWIISNALNMGIVAIVVLFQPELRKALEQIGRGKISLPFLDDGEPPGLTANTVWEVAKAVKNMADQRCGALILLEQDVPLGDHEQTGVPIGAIVTSQLLINIFVDKTPLHDGAVIIRNNRIAAASCILPLTQTEIGQELGTRHRAAVGVSEESDAIVIVVSEETGKISVVRGGRLSQGVSEQELRNLLSEHTLPEKKTLKWRKFFSLREKP